MTIKPKETNRMRDAVLAAKLLFKFKYISLAETNKDFTNKVNWLVRNDNCHENIYYDCMRKLL